MTCPACGAPIGKPAAEGGLLIRNRYVRLADGKLIVGCPGCQAELETRPNRVLVLLRRSTKRSSPPSAPTPPTA